jgi:hypothetical protein
MAQMNVRTVSMKEYRDVLVKRMTTRLKAVEACDYDVNLPLFVWGNPGIGKSMILSAICRETWTKAKTAMGKPLMDEVFLNHKRPWDASNWCTYTPKDIAELEKNPTAWILMDVRLSQIDPVEIKGAPFYDTVNMKASFIRFSSILPDPKCKWPVFLFLDEFVLAPDMVQSAGYQLINERKIGDYRLPENCVTIAAGNPSGINGVHFEMSLALENRFDHIFLDVDYDGFVKYIANGHNYDETMVAFLQYSKEQDKDAIYHIEGQQGKGNFPTFRSWEKALKKVKYGEKPYNAIADSVGQAGATKFETFKELTKDIPDAKTLVDKKMYYKEIQLQLVASQKVGNQLLNKDIMDKLTDDRAFEVFRYFVDMKNPKDANDKREELTILFLVNVRDNMEVLEKIDSGFKKALKKGVVKMEKNAEGDNIADIYGLIFHKWHSLSDLD